MKYLPCDRDSGLLMYGVFIDLEVSHCNRCWWPLVRQYECPSRDLTKVTMKRVEARTWPCHGLWFFGEEHTFERCLEMKPE